MAVVVLPGAQLSSIGVVVDAFAHLSTWVAQQTPAGSQGRMGTTVKLVAPSKRPVVLAGGRVIACDADIESDELFRWAYLPGFILGDDGTTAETWLRAQRLDHWLVRQHRAGALLAASGAASLLMARTGLLDGGEVAVSDAVAPLLRRYYPAVRPVLDAALVESRGVLTCSAPQQEWPMALRAIEKLISPFAAQALAHATGMQAELPAAPKGADRLISRAQYWLSKRYASDPRMSDLAAEMAVSHATLIRRFERSLGMTPRDYVQQLRVTACRHLLQSTAQGVEEIAARVGYADGRALRRQFRRLMGCSPTEYRRAHQPDADALEIAEGMGLPALCWSRPSMTIKKV